MPKRIASVQSARTFYPPPADGGAVLALNEFELSARWRMSVHTLRRWRQDQQGPVFCKVGARVTYLLSEVEAFERRVSRYSTFARAYQ